MQVPGRNPTPAGASAAGTEVAANSSPTKPGKAASTPVLWSRSLRPIKSTTIAAWNVFFLFCNAQ